MRRLFKTTQFIVPALAVVSMAFATFFSTPTQAADCLKTRGWCNSQEYNAAQLCNAGGMSTQQSGAIWFNTSSTAATDTGYYSGTVNVTSGATSIDVNIRGSVRSCAANWNNNTIRAVDVAPGGGETRLSNLQGTSFERGTAQNQPNTWSTQGSSLRATLNVSGIATNNVNGVASQTINVYLNRCYSSNGKRGKCSVEAIPVTVVRDKQPRSWDTSGRTLVGVDHEPNVSNWTAAPGNKVNWRHYINNTKSDATDGIAFAINRSGFPSAVWNGVYQQNPAARAVIAGNSTFEFGYNRGYSNYSSYAVTQNDVGRKLCQSASWGPRSSTNNAWMAGDQACVDVVYNFNLTPLTTVPEVAEPGSSINVTHSISNSGPTKSYDATDWRTISFVLSPGETPKPSADTTSTSCAYFGGQDCKIIAQGGFSGMLPGGAGTVTGSDTVTADDRPSGSKICFATSVTKYVAGKAASDWRHSTAECATISKKPKTQIWGGDLRVDGKTSTSLSIVGGTTYGSWGEYGIFSTKVNSGLSSGAALVTGSATPTQSGWSALTFANVSGYGAYATSLPLSTLANQFVSLPAATPALGATVDVSTLGGSSSRAYEASSSVTNITLRGNVQKGKTIIINATGKTVTIDNNITYDGASLSSLSDIPQLVIVAQNIYIKSGVSNVDGWLLATGAIDTCSDAGTAGMMPSAKSTLTQKVCDKQLTVHGPVAATKLVLKRTFGADKDSRTDAAEVFNLRPDAYLWAYGRSASTGQVRTVYASELPPRF